MSTWFRRGSCKPPSGAEVDFEHPLGRKLLLAVLFNDPGTSAVVTNPRILFNGVARNAVPSSGTVPSLSGTQQGTSAFCAPAASFDLGETTSWLPTTAVTVCAIQGKIDTTNRVSSLFAVANAVLGTEYFNAHVPFSDGVVYWEFGGFAAPNRLTATGLTFSGSTPRVPDKWVFTAGPQGSTIWQNGIKVASQATAITRTAANSTSHLLLNDSDVPGVAGDNCQINFFQILGTQWSDQLCRWWSAQPYAAFYPDTSGLFFNPQAHGGGGGAGKGSQGGKKGGGGGLNILHAGGTLQFNLGNPGLDIGSN